jgi:predicted transcriptional regulator
MTQEEIAVKFEGHDHEIGSLKHRTKNLEEQTKSIQELVISVKELAMNMKNMIEEQKTQGERLLVLETKPARRWDALVTALISAGIGAFITYLIK